MESTLTLVRPTDHSHRWVIDEPNGPVSRGRCKVCRIERDFKNWLVGPANAGATVIKLMRLCSVPMRVWRPEPRRCG